MGVDKFMCASDHNRLVRAGFGFTLAEVIVALTIFAVGIVGVLASFSQSMRVGSRAARLDEAIEIAESRLELVTAAVEGTPESSTGSCGRYAWRATFAEKPHGLIQASVEVRWWERGIMEKFVLSQCFLPHQKRASSDDDLASRETLNE